LTALCRRASRRGISYYIRYETQTYSLTANRSAERAKLHLIKAASSDAGPMWLASAVGSLNVARLGGVSLQPVVNGQVSSTEAPVEAGSLWAGTGAVIFTVRRAG
jgi:L-aminopeptidase/D-esterase-like protein